VALYVIYKFFVSARLDLERFGPVALEKAVFREGWELVCYSPAM